MDRFIDACVGHYRTIIMVLILILISGWDAYTVIPKERSPDVQIPVIYTTMTHEGISPEDAERLLIRPMEKEMRTIEGVKEMKANASEGHASVTLEFFPGFDSDKALDDVREAVDTAKVELPEETDEPEVHEVNLSLFPVVNVILTSSLPEHAMTDIAEHLQDKIEELSNVLSVNIAGSREEVVEVIIDPAMIEAYGLSLEAIGQIANGFNQLVAAGALEGNTGRYAIKVPGLLENVGDILSLPVASTHDAVVTLGDIARLRKTFRDATSIARANGQAAMVLEVSKRTGTNIIETIEQVKQVVEREKQYLPQNLAVSYAQDQSERIMEMLQDLQNNIILAIILVMVVIIYYVGVRSAMLITIAIPGAFLMGILFLYHTGLTLNIVVLFSLILSIGMLVDAAIIICEMADRKMAEGRSAREAFSTAAKYMKWPIIASTATTLVVFAPLLFWPGIVGQFMQYMPITLIAILSASLIMAIIFIPTLGTIAGKPKEVDESVMEQIHATEAGELEKLTGMLGVYCRTLRWVLHHSKRFVVIIFSLLIAVYIIYAILGTGVEFFPDTEPDNGIVQIRARGNLSLEEKDAAMREVEERLFDLQDEVKMFYTRTGAQAQGGKDAVQDAIGTVTMEYENWQIRRSATEINQEIRERLSNIPGVLIDVKVQQGGPKSDKPISLKVLSRYPDLLEPAVEKILSKMVEIGGFVDIDDNRAVPLIEWKITLDRKKAAQYGTDVATIGAFVKLVTNGMMLTSYRPDDSDEEVDIIARFPENKRTLEALNTLKVMTPSGSVPLSFFTTRKPQPQVSQINRTEGQRALTINANVAPGVLANTLVEEMRGWFQSGVLDPRVSILFQGDDEKQKETGAFLKSAFGLALFAMALILVTQFNSVYYMIIIMSAVFLSTIGVLLGLIITAQPFGIVMCGVGIIALSGIVVNNNIIFIDTYQKLLNEGMDVEEALLRTGVQRLRPILLTAGTTVLGLIPMVLSMNIDFVTREVTFGAPSSQWWVQLSTSIAGGLAFATILTLFFTPAVLKIGQKFSVRR